MDYQFQAEFIPRTASAQAQRWALLRPLTRRLDLYSDVDVKRGANQILGLWRRRLSLLKEAGWAPAQGLSFQYMRNCPPVMVAARPVGRERYSRPCHKPTVCPWCWGREVVKRTWDQVIEAMTVLDSLYAGGRAAYPYKLVLIRRFDRQPLDPSEPRRSLDLAVGSMGRTKRNILRAGGAGLVSVGAVYPVRDKWVQTVRYLALAPWGLPTSPENVVVTRPTRRNLAKVIGLACRYPAGLLFGSPAQVAQLLDARGGHRLLRFAGVFNKNTSPRDSGPDGGPPAHDASNGP